MQAAGAAGGLGLAEDIRFHDVLAEAAQNPALRRFAAFIGRHAREAMQLARLTQLRYENRLAEIAAEHAAIIAAVAAGDERSEEHTSELQSLMRTSYAVFCLKKKTNNTREHRQH